MDQKGEKRFTSEHWLSWFFPASSKFIRIPYLTITALQAIHCFPHFPCLPYILFYSQDNLDPFTSYISQ